MSAFQFSGISPTHKFTPPNSVNYAKSYVPENYDVHKIDRGFKTFVGWIVDTLV